MDDLSLIPILIPDLPVDVYPLIFEHLRGKTLFYVAQSCHYFWDIVYRYVNHVQLKRLEIDIDIKFSSSYISFRLYNGIDSKTNIDLSKNPDRRVRAYTSINYRLNQLELTKKSKDIPIFFMPTFHPIFDKILLNRIYIW